MKTWKRRWFILTDNCLYYFEYTTVRAERADKGQDGGGAGVPGSHCKGVTEGPI